MVSSENYSSKKRAMTSSITDDCGVLGARFFREAPVWCRADWACGDGVPGCEAGIAAEAPAGCCGCGMGAVWVWFGAEDEYGAGRACGDGAPGCGAAIGAVPYRDWLCKPVEEYGDDNAVLNSGCGGSVRAGLAGRLSTSVLRSALYA